MVVLLSVRSDNFITRICVQDTLDVTFQLRDVTCLLRDVTFRLRAVTFRLRSGYVLLRKKPTE